MSAPEVTIEREDRERAARFIYSDEYMEGVRGCGLQGDALAARRRDPRSRARHRATPRRPRHRKPAPYDLRTLEMVLAWCEREERDWGAEYKGSDYQDYECRYRLAQVAKLKRMVKRHAARARKGAR